MKTNLLFLLMLIICGFSNITAQEKKISEQEITTLRNNASEKLKSKSYQVKMNSESYRNTKDSSPYWFIKSTTEYTLDGYHSVTETRSVEGLKRRETINVGNRRFSKEDNEPWKELSPTQGFGGGSGLQPSSIESETTVEYKHLGKKEIINQKADLYEVKKKTKYKIKDREFLSIYTEKFWFNKDGLFLKTEDESENNGKVTSHTVREYEYDSNIKVEAPIK
jgi:hypothetical protein